MSVETTHVMVLSKCWLQVIKAVRFCNAFSLPIISLLLHHEGEAATEGVTRVSDLANLIFAYSEAAVPKLAVLCGPEAVPAGKVQQIRSASHLLHLKRTTAGTALGISAAAYPGGKESCLWRNAGRGVLWCTSMTSAGLSMVHRVCEEGQCC